MKILFDSATTRIISWIQARMPKRIDFIRNRHDFFIGLICAYAVTAFPYPREYMTQLVLLVILLWAVYVAKINIKHYGCYH